MLEAQAQLLAIEAAAFPHLTEQARRSIIDRWQRRAADTPKYRSLHEALQSTGRIQTVEVPAAKAR